MVFRFYSNALKNAGNAISETLNSKMFLVENHPAPLIYVITLWGPKLFLAPGPTRSAATVTVVYEVMQWHGHTAIFLPENIMVLQFFKKLGLGLLFFLNLK